MSVIINGTDGVTFNDASLQGAAASPFTLKNRIINGDMRIDQRNNGASVTPISTDYTLDRWQYSASQNSKFSFQQNAASVTPPTGFKNYLGITTTSAVSVGASDYFQTVQKVEGFNVSDLGWGTASASAITLSFWVRSSLTGTFGGALQNSAQDRCYPYSYTISSANTWEYKTITIAGDTSGTWLTTNGIGIRIGFGLGVGTTYSGTAGAWAGATYFSATGATSVVGTSGATFYITGVQLEVGTSATPFERRLFNQELANCQRYYEQFVHIFLNMSNGGFSNSYSAIFNFLVEKRATPTVTTFSGANISGTSGNVTLYPGTVNSSASYDILTTKNYNITKEGTSTYNLVTFSATISSEL
jgi:hypothetical protein